MICYSNKMPYVYLFLVHFARSLIQKIEEKDSKMLFLRARISQSS